MRTWADIDITLNKNIVVYNHQNFLNICKGYYVTTGSQIHNNSKISLVSFL